MLSAALLATLAWQAAWCDWSHTDSHFFTYGSTLHSVCPCHCVPARCCEWRHWNRHL